MTAHEVTELLETMKPTELPFWLGQAYATLMASPSDYSTSSEQATANSTARAIISFCNARNVR
jgi:hypothetical protein